MELIKTLTAVRNTLDGIEVKGKDNLDMLLGCIQTLEKTVMALRNAEKPGEVENDE